MNDTDHPRPRRVRRYQRLPHLCPFLVLVLLNTTTPYNKRNDGQHHVAASTLFLLRPQGHVPM